MSVFFLFCFIEEFVMGKMIILEEIVNIFNVLFN